METLQVRTIGQYNSMYAPRVAWHMSNQYSITWQVFCSIQMFHSLLVHNILHKVPQKQSSGVKSGDLGGQTMVSSLFPHPAALHFFHPTSCTAHLISYNWAFLRGLAHWDLYFREFEHYDLFLENLSFNLGME
jgi:hypothetical protein